VPPHPFTLTKWYLDCVDADGRAAIAYWATVAWYGVVVPWQRATLYDPGRAAREYTSLRATPPPGPDGDRLAWHAPAVSCELEYDRAAPAAALTLLDDARGAIRWRCEMPAARARCAFGGFRPFAGTGYAERIELTVAPWRIPIDELRWGRWIADDASRSVVWIDWRGEMPGTWVLVDGILAGSAAVRDDAVFLDHEASLTLDRGRTLHEESVAGVVRAVPGLAGLLRGTPLAMRDAKWCARAALATPGESPIPGWAIHEIVWMR
jgi:hypothetical protein